MTSHLYIGEDPDDANYSPEEKKLTLNDVDSRPGDDFPYQWIFLKVSYLKRLDKRKLYVAGLSVFFYIKSY